MDRPGNLMDYLSINPLDQPAENDLRKLIKYYFIWYSHDKYIKLLSLKKNN